MKDVYIIVTWPESQDFIGRAHCHLINDDQGYLMYGSSAYFVRADVYEEVTGTNILDTLLKG